MSNEIIATDLHSAAVDNLVTLFILELPNGTKLYFHPGLDSALSEVTFRDDTSPFTTRTYTALPIDLSGVEVTGDGASNRPTLTIANVLTVFRDLLPEFGFDKVVGSRLTKRLTLEKHLSSGSASAAPVEFPKVTYVVDRVKSETSEFVTFELASPFDVEGITLPRRTVVGKYCSWKYKQGPIDGGCTWESSSMMGTGVDHRVFFTLDDELVTDSSNVASAAAYDATTTYSSDTVVTVSSVFYQSKVDGNRGNDPTTFPDAWNKIHKYTTWADATAYTETSFVFHAGVLYKCLKAHTSTNSLQPQNSGHLWEHGDLCGKTLTSCNIRYNAQPASGQTGTDRLVSCETRNVLSLPFGGFPGSNKHR